MKRGVGFGRRPFCVSRPLRSDTRWALNTSRVMEGEMRKALLVLTIVAALDLSRSAAWANFSCFETPEGERRCACVGADNCAEMKTSDSCKSDAQCDDRALGVIICNCKAAKSVKRGP